MATKKDGTAPPPAEKYGQLSLGDLAKQAEDCTNCDLHLRGTQTVFGEGNPGARVMFVGEQPGDQEDRTGHPFVGPAGRILDKALDEVGLRRDQVYVTNAVKHFKWIASGKRRIHQKPNAREVSACKGWLEAEIAALKPKVIVCLGATAAQALLGRHFRVTQQRGVPISSPLAPFVLATIHPSAILRAPDEESRQREYEGFVADLRQVKANLDS
jgi:uracil-DNA glycosylase family protein